MVNHIWKYYRTNATIWKKGTYQTTTLHYAKLETKKIKQTAHKTTSSTATEQRRAKNAQPTTTATSTPARTANTGNGFQVSAKLNRCDTNLF